MNLTFRLSLIALALTSAACGHSHPPVLPPSQGSCPKIDGAYLVSLDPLATSCAMENAAGLSTLNGPRYGVASMIVVDEVGSFASIQTPYGNNVLRGLSESELQAIENSADSSCRYSFEGKTYEIFYPATIGQLGQKTFVLNYPGYSCRNMLGETVPSRVDLIRFGDSRSQLDVTSFGDLCTDAILPPVDVSPSSYLLSTDGETLISYRGAYRRAQ